MDGGRCARTGLRLDDRDVDALVEAEVVATLGIGAVAASHLVVLARRLHEDLAESMAALETGRLDLTRVRVLADLTGDLPGPVATLVQDAVLPGAGSAPWDGPSPVTWRRRIHRAVKRFRVQAPRAERESLAAQTRTWVQVDDSQPALSTFSIVAPTEDILWLDQAVTDCALQRPDADTRGRSLTSGQRRVAALFDMVENVAVGRDPARVFTTVPGDGAAPGTCSEAGSGTTGGRRGRDRELGLVMHADTFFGDGPAAGDPGEVRGLGAPAPIDADTARELARGRLASASTCVLLADGHGDLQRLVRVGRPPDGGWTRQSLVAAIRAQLAKEEATTRDQLSTDRVRTDDCDLRPRPCLLSHVHSSRLPPHLPRLRPRS